MAGDWFGGRYEEPPDVVNGDGTKFWLNTSLTSYAKGLKGVQVCNVEFANGQRTFLIAENGTPVHEDQSYEGVACHIDAMRLARDMTPRDSENIGSEKPSRPAEWTRPN